MAKNGNGGTSETKTAAAPARDPKAKYDDQGRKLYKVRQVVEGRVFEREVPLIGIPFWVPQKRADQPRMVLGVIEEIVTIEPQPDTGFDVRQGILLSTKAQGFLVVPAGAAIERQITEMNLGAGEEILVEYNGVGKDKGNGRKPALRMNISKCIGTAPDGTVQTMTTTTAAG